VNKDINEIIDTLDLQSWDDIVQLDDTDYQILGEVKE